MKNYNDNKYINSNNNGNSYNNKNSKSAIKIIELKNIMIAIKKRLSQSHPSVCMVTFETT